MDNNVAIPNMTLVGPAVKVGAFAFVPDERSK
jgi:hypothetical protein